MSVRRRFNTLRDISTMNESELEFQRWRTEVEAEIERIKGLNETWIERYRAEQEANRDNFKAVIEFANATIRSIILANGAAVISLLTFIGSIVSNFDQNRPGILEAIIWPMHLFAWGTACGICVPAASYLAQSFYMDFPRDDGSPSKLGQTFRIIAILLAAASLAFFVYGVIESGNGFLQIASLPEVKAL